MLEMENFVRVLVIAILNIIAGIIAIIGFYKEKRKGERTKQYRRWRKMFLIGIILLVLGIVVIILAYIV